MVRLVFRPYTQVWRSICTSESLRASTRVSSGFALLKHSSPSFGSQQMCSYSNLSRSRIGRSMMRSSGGKRSHFSCKQPLLSLCLRVSITLRLAHMLDSLVRVSRRVVWNHMTANNLGTFVHSSPRQPIAVQTHCVQSVMVEYKLRERGQPKRACTATPLSGPNSPPRAITLAGASHLLTRLFAWSQQLLTHAAKKCDGPQKKANADGLFGSVQHLQLLQPTWISTTHC